MYEETTPKFWNAFERLNKRFEQFKASYRAKYHKRYYYTRLIYNFTANPNEPVGWYACGDDWKSTDPFDSYATHFLGDNACVDKWIYLTCLYYGLPCPENKPQGRIPKSVKAHSWTQFDYTVAYHDIRKHRDNDWNNARWQDAKHSWREYRRTHDLSNKRRVDWSKSEVQSVLYVLTHYPVVLYSTVFA